MSQGKKKGIGTEVRWVYLNYLGACLYQCLHEVCVSPPGGEVHCRVSQGLLHMHDLLLRQAAQQLPAHVIVARLDGTKQRNAATRVL